MGSFERKQTPQIQTFMEYTCTLTLSRTHTHTYFTQCQIKITQGNFQGCIYNHNDKNSIFEVAEVKEQTTAQAN